MVQISRGGGKTLGSIKVGRVSETVRVEYDHVFITQRVQLRYDLPNWLVNNRVNVWKLNTIQHALIDSYRFRFIKKAVKPDVGFLKKYNWFTNKF
jgi:hypothetical protein